ncbi:MAG: alpha/beta fold hydrolase [Chloroflexota bacterium]|nr:alpha/beta fold hydrolase [Chloroflexota bacterium]
MINLTDRQMTPSKWARALLVILAFFVVDFAVIYPIYRAHLLTHPHSRPMELTETQTGTPVERVAFQATDGVELVGWFVSNPASQATIIGSHGSGANGPSAWSAVRFLHDAGFNVFLFDHRGHGQSGGRYTTLGPLEVRDFLGAVAYVRSRPDVAPDRIGAYGFSMGAGVVVVAAAESPDIHAVVADSVFADLGDVVRRMGTVWLRGSNRSFSWGQPMLWACWLWTGQDLDAYEPVAVIGRISPRPVLLIHGELDNGACTVANARELYAAAGEPKALWIVPEAGHCGAHLSAPAEYERRVLATFRVLLPTDSVEECDCHR